MYGLSRTRRPQAWFRELLHRRVNRGTYPKGPSPDEYLADIYASLEHRWE